MGSSLRYSIILISLNICLIILCVCYFYLKKPFKYNGIKNKDKLNLIRNYKIIKYQKSVIRKLKFEILLLDIIPFTFIKKIIKIPKYKYIKHGGK